MFKKSALILAIVSLLNGCMPYATRYIELSAPNATPVLELCKDFGPPIAITFEKNTAKFQVSLEPGNSRRSKNGYIKVYVAENTLVAVASNSANLSPESHSSDQKTREITLNLQNTETPNWARKMHLMEYRYEMSPLPQIQGSGTLTLPDFYINQIRTTMPLIEYKRKSHVSFTPLNC